MFFTFEKGEIRKDFIKDWRHYDRIFDIQRLRDKIEISIGQGIKAKTWNHCDTI